MNSEPMLGPAIIFTLAMLGFSAFCLYANFAYKKQRKELKKHGFDGFSINMFLDEDGQYTAFLVEYPSCSAFGDTPEDALTELHSAWDLLKETCIELGDEVPTVRSQKNVCSLV